MYKGVSAKMQGFGIGSEGSFSLKPTKLARVDEATGDVLWSEVDKFLAVSYQVRGRYNSIYRFFFAYNGTLEPEVAVQQYQAHYATLAETAYRVLLEVSDKGYVILHEEGDPDIPQRWMESTTGQRCPHRGNPFGIPWNPISTDDSPTE